MNRVNKGTLTDININVWREGTWQIQPQTSSYEHTSQGHVCVWLRNHVLRGAWRHSVMYTALYRPNNATSSNYKTWLNIFCRLSLSHPSLLQPECRQQQQQPLQCTVTKKDEWITKKRCYIYFIFIQDIKISYLHSFSQSWENMKTFTSYISVQAALFQPGGVGCRFTFPWWCARCFFRGSFSQVVQLNGWSRLLGKRQKEQSLHIYFRMWEKTVSETYESVLIDYLHEVVCDVLWLQACDSLWGSLRYVDPEVPRFEPTEVCKQMCGLSVQGWRGTGQDLQMDYRK